MTASNKDILIFPELLTANGTRFTKVVQELNLIVCVMPFAFHKAHNEGLNIAEIINFDTKRWMQYEKQL